ncbi:MAG TPA: bifunctional DNA-formamidopyrimidine glycosylase/DNA-(apurinic or apyrimidinic site) lyase, partial [bacterium]|nr:bifunctional DNA-formamidopyrimidine glycosylase/DNA-(apurinic or apyrimidinic site) lyase [bacterium]
ELPEVETIRRGLWPRLKGRSIARAEVRLKKQVRGMSAQAFEKALAGRRMVGLERRAKFLLFGLDSGLTLLGHLGMSGQISYWDRRKPDSAGFVVSPLTGLQRTPQQHAVDKHTHVLLHLDNGDRVQYRDTRQFGYLRLLPSAAVAALPSIARLGLEPLGPGFTWEAFQGALAGRRGGLKALLLGQAAVVGLGNIYSDEACFLAGLHPRQRLERLKEPQRRALFDAIPAVLHQALDNGGTTLMDYRTADGQHGLNQDRLQAYGRGGEACLRCGRALKKIQVSQRTTVFCPHCQHLR